MQAWVARGACKSPATSRLNVLLSRLSAAGIVGAAEGCVAACAADLPRWNRELFGTSALPSLLRGTASWLCRQADSVPRGTDGCLRHLSPLLLRSWSNAAVVSTSEDDGHEAFQRAADAMLDTLQEELEAVLDERGVEEADLEFGQGVMTLTLGGLGTYVINKQGPNQEIWMSSPVSGPVRYGFHDGQWVYGRDGHVLHDRLEAELSELLDGPVKLTR